MVCYCGCSSFSSIEKKYFQVTLKGETLLAQDKMVVEVCNSCGVTKQSAFSPLWKNDYEKYYAQYPPTQEEYVAKDREHDVKVASSRANFYSIGPGSEILLLDVGSGSGAFVHECLNRGVKAYGCEISAYHSAFSQNIYQRRFEDIYFPTDFFDVVTCHDVVEHVQDPLSFFKELFRVVKEEGTLWLEIPDFFCADGGKHWKKEHLWFFRSEDIKTLAEKVGFSPVAFFHPISGKVLFQLQKPEQKRPSVLVPPGIGDSYWSIIKLEAMLREKGLPLPNVSVVCPRSKKHNGHQRAFPFLEMFPFLHASWDVVDNQDVQHKAIWQEAYSFEGRTLFEKVLGHDFFLSYNGHLRIGKELDTVDPQWETDWHPKMFVSLEQELFQKYAAAQYGKYIVFYFIFQGTYSYWTRQFPVTSVIESVKRICESTGCLPVFVGGKWDAEDSSLSEVIRKVPGAINIVGKTSLQQVFGLIKGAEMVVGYPSGLTIMAAVLRQKTLVVWNDYYNRDFFNNAMPPDVRGKTYFADHTYKLTPEILRKECASIISGEKIKPRPLPAELTVVVPSSVRNNRSLSIVSGSCSKVSSLAVLCVLRSGGDFGPEYVHNLIGSLRRNSGEENPEYICLTDMDIKSPYFKTVPLKKDLPGWWSKVEIFRPGITTAKYCVYFDLDTVILKDVSDLLSAQIPGSFAALLPWNSINRASGDFASGVMRWETALYPFFYNEYEKNKDRIFAGDQQYFSYMVRKRGYPWSRLQQYFPGIYSYKRNARNGTVPRDARIVCFHGKPRPHEVNHTWIKENWRT